MKYTVTGALYSDVATYYSWDTEKRWKNYNKVDERIWTIEADDLDAAERWLAVTHPEYYMGGCVVAEDKQSFVMTAIPSIEYGEGNYETVEARKRWVRANF